MKFQALIDSIHFDPKKGTVKIVLVGTSHVSLDELTTIGPKDESIWVTLESEQTRLDYGLKPGDAIALDDEAVEKLKNAAERLKAGKIDTEELAEEGQKGFEI